MTEVRRRQKAKSKDYDWTNVETLEKFAEHHGTVGVAYKYEKRMKDPQERKQRVEVAFNAANCEQDAAVDSERKTLHCHVILKRVAFFRLNWYLIVR